MKPRIFWQKNTITQYLLERLLVVPLFQNYLIFCVSLVFYIDCISQKLSCKTQGISTLSLESLRRTLVYSLVLSKVQIHLRWSRPSTFNFFLESVGKKKCRGRMHILRPKSASYQLKASCSTLKSKIQDICLECILLVYVECLVWNLFQKVARHLSASRMSTVFAVQSISYRSVT